MPSLKCITKQKYIDAKVAEDLKWGFERKEPRREREIVMLAHDLIGLHSNEAIMFIYIL